MRTSRGGRARSTLGATAALVLAALAGAGSVGATTIPSVVPPSAVGGERLASDGLVLDAPGAQPLPQIGAAAWVLADLDTGEVLAARNPHGRFRPASTMKILTALTVLPQLAPESTYTVQFEDANAEGSKVGIVPDATYTVRNLFEALFLVSGNDAAHALANAAGGDGGVARTVARMNEVARSLGALDTKAVNPSGLDAPGQLTSAYDLAVISRAAMQREDFRAYVATVKSQFPGAMPKPGKVRKTYEIYTQDRLLLNYRGAIGVKTGWTTKARGTFVGAATRNGRTLVATVLHTDNDSWREAGALLTWGFRNAGMAEPVGTLDAVPAATSDTRAGAPTAASASSSAATAGAGDGLPWWLQVPIVLLGVVAALRARVLLRARLRAVRRRRAVRAPLLPQPRDRRRATSAVAAAPTPAPSSAARPRPRPEGESSASAGTGS